MPGRGASPSSTAARPACRPACAGRCSTRCRSTSTGTSLQPVVRVPVLRGRRRAVQARVGPGAGGGPPAPARRAARSRTRGRRPRLPRARRAADARRRFAAGVHRDRTRATNLRAWEAFLAALPPPAGAAATMAGPSAELLYVFDPVRSTTTPGMFVELLRRQRRKNGDWAAPRDVFHPARRGQGAARPGRSRDPRTRLRRGRRVDGCVEHRRRGAGPLALRAHASACSATSSNACAATGRLMLRPIGADGDPTHARAHPMDADDRDVPPRRSTDRPTPGTR